MTNKIQTFLDFHNFGIIFWPSADNTFSKKAPKQKNDPKYADLGVERNLGEVPDSLLRGMRQGVLSKTPALLSQANQ